MISDDQFFMIINFLLFQIVTQKFEDKSIGNNATEHTIHPSTKKLLIKLMIQGIFKNVKTSKQNLTEGIHLMRPVASFCLGLHLIVP